MPKVLDTMPLATTATNERKAELDRLREHESLLIEERRKLVGSLAVVETELSQIQAAIVETEHNEYRVVSAKDVRPVLPFLEAVSDDGVPRIVTHAHRAVGDALLQPYADGMEFDESRPSWRLTRGLRALLLEAASGKRILLTGDEEARPLAILGPMTAEAVAFVQRWRALRATKLPLIGR